MELPPITFELTKDYLLVNGHGTRDSLASMTQAAKQIFEKAIETNSNKMLVDYRALRIEVNMTEAFNIVKRYEASIPDLKKIKVAAVFANEGLTFGKYWMDISKKRGFNIQIFEDFEKAKTWLLAD